MKISLCDRGLFGKCGNIWSSPGMAMVAVLMGVFSAGSARGQIFVSSDSPGNAVGKYDATTGAALNTSLITGLSSPYGLAIDGASLYIGNTGGNAPIGQYTTGGTTVNASLIQVAPGWGSIGITVSGNTVYVTRYNLGTIASFDATTGAVINASLVSGLSAPYGLALDGSGNMYVANAGNGTVSKYTTSGTLVNSSLIQGLSTPFGLAVSDGNLFVTEFGGGKIGKYSTSGAAINASLVTGLSDPTGIAISGGRLYVANYGSGKIGEYYAANGTVINASLVSVSAPIGLAAMPEDALKPVVLLAGSVPGQIFVTSDSPGNTIGKYDATTGAAINATLVTGLSSPYSLALDGGSIYVGNIGGNAPIGQYTTTGTTVNASLIQVAPGWGSIGMAVSGNTLYATRYNLGTIASFDATTGAVINASLVSGLSAPYGLALDGSGNMYVANAGNGTVSKYTTSGTLVNSSLIQGLSTPFGLAVSDGNLFVTEFGGGKIGKYSTSGAAINASLVTGLGYPTGIAILGERLYVANYGSGKVGEYYAGNGTVINASLVSVNAPLCLAAMPTPPLTLATNGIPAYTVVLPAAPTTQEQKAADDLLVWLSAMTGVTFSVVRESGGGIAGNIISIGKTQLALNAGFSDTGLGTEGYDIEVADANLFLMGGSARGPINAVYALLEEDLGCRWYAPGTSTIPQVLSFRAVPRRFLPSLEVRDPLYFDAFDATWSLQNKTISPFGFFPAIPEAYGGNLSCPPGYFVHTFAKLLPPSIYFQSHPEYFSMINGVRTTDQIDVTNPNVLAIVIAQVQAVLRANPNAKLISVSQNDGAIVGCTCPTCQAITDAEGSLSGPLLMFVNSVADAIAQEFPNVKVSTLAYEGTFMAPKTIRPRPNVVIQLCTDTHAWTTPFLTVTETTNFQTAMKAWEAIGANIHIWDYTANYSHHSLPMPNMPVVTPDIQFYIAHHAKGVMLQGAYQSPGSDNGPMRSWVWAKQLWNPSLDTKALMRDFIYGYYGTSAIPIEQYNNNLWDMWNTYHSLPHAPGTPVSVNPIMADIVYLPEWAPFTNDFLTQSFQLFAQAAALAQDPVTASRVELAKLPTMYLKLCRGIGYPAYRGQWQPVGLGDVIMRRPNEGTAYYQALITEVQQTILTNGITNFHEGAVDASDKILFWQAALLPRPLPAPYATLPVQSVVDISARMLYPLAGPANMCGIASDTAALSGEACYMTSDNTQWSIQFQNPSSVVSGSWRVLVDARLEVTSTTGQAFDVGLYGLQRGSNSVTTTQISSFGDGAYHLVDCGVFDFETDSLLYLAPKNNPTQIGKIFVDRILLVKQ